MKILMSAYACEPGKSSEPAVGWNWALQAARWHEVWVLTRSNNRQAIETAMAESPVENLHFVYHDLPRWASFWKRGGRGLHLYYLLWQLTALGLARRLRTEIGFDLGHHVTFVSYRFPSFLAWLGIPYVWGPVAGAETAPKSFYHTFGWRGVVHQTIRDTSKAVVKFDPLVRRTARRARTVIAATPETAAALESLNPGHGLTSLAIGWAGELRPPSLQPGPLRVIFVGRLIHWKGLHLGLTALAKVLEIRPDITLTVVGNGPERRRLERQVARLGITSAVTFTGQVPTELVHDLLRQHNCLIFPSFQDSGGFAVLEAMANGLPVICFGIGGPALLVGKNTGIRIQPDRPGQVVEEMQSAMVRLNDDEVLRADLGREGLKRVEREFAWERSGDLIHDVYSQAIELDSAD